MTDEQIDDLIKEKTEDIYCVKCEAEQNEGPCTHDTEEQFFEL